MSNLWLVRGARQLITLRGPSEARRGPALSELGIIQDGAVLIRDGLIVSVGPSRRVENLREAREAEVIEAAGRVVTPGLVDCHTQFFPGPGLRSPTGFLVHPPSRASALNWNAVLRSSSRRRILWEYRRWLHELLRHGTTTAEAKSGWGLDEAAALKLLRIFAHLQGGPADVIATYSLPACSPRYGRDDPVHAEELLNRLLPLLVRRRLARLLEVCVDSGGYAVEPLRQCTTRAAELGLRLKIHAAPSAQQEAVRLALDLEARSVNALTRIALGDIARLAASPVIVTLVPALCLTGQDPGAGAVRELIRAGAAIALGTGYGISPPHSLAAAMALACLHWRMEPAEALTAATINAAYALDVARRLGSLEPGKQADLVIFDVRDYREIACHLGVNLVSTVLKRGVLVYHRGEILWNED